MGFSLKGAWNKAKNVGEGFASGLPGIGDVISRERERNAANDLTNSYGEIDRDLYSNIQPSGYDGSLGSANEIQRSGIQSLMERAKGGLTAADRAANYQLGQETMRANRGAREAILGRARAQGSLTSGNTLSAQLAANEAATGRLRANQLGIAGMASDRANEANQALLGYDSAERARRFNQQLALAGDRANLRTGGALARRQGVQDIQEIDAAKRKETNDALMKILSMGRG